MIADRISFAKRPPIDHVTISIAQFSDDDIEDMGRQDLIDLLRLPYREPCSRDLVAQVFMEIGELRDRALRYRDQCQLATNRVYVPHARHVLEAVGSAIQ